MKYQSIKWIDSKVHPGCQRGRKECWQKKKSNPTSHYPVNQGDSWASSKNLQDPTIDTYTHTSETKEASTLNILSAQKISAK